MWTWIALGILVILGLYIWFYRPMDLKTTKKEALDLQTAPQIGDTQAAQTVLLNSNTGTVQTFVYPLGYQRTGQLTMCSSTTPTAPGEPDCATGRFNMCVCEGGNCDKCKHKGYVNVINMSNIVRIELLTVPDASRQKMAGCQLVVRTMRNPLPPNAKQGRCPQGYFEFGPEGTGFCCPVEPIQNNTKCSRPVVDTKEICALDTDNKDGKPLCSRQIEEIGTIIQEETMELPNIPLQKWTMITIAREGRRFDIYYNGSLVLSKRTQYMIASTAAFGPIIAGDPNLIGKVAETSVYPEKKTGSEILSMYSKLSDTNGAPYLQKNIDLLSLIPSCEGGNCMKGPVVRPASPLMDWETEYA